MKGASGQHGEAGRVEGPEEGRERESSGEVGRDLVGDLSSFTEMQFPTFSFGGDLLRFGETSFPGEASLEGEAALERERRPQSHQAPPSPRPSFVAGEIFPDRRQFQERARRWRPVVSILSLTHRPHPPTRPHAHPYYSMCTSAITPDSCFLKPCCAQVLQDREAPPRRTLLLYGYQRAMALWGTLAVFHEAGTLPDRRPAAGHLLHSSEERASTCVQRPTPAVASGDAHHARQAISAANDRNGVQSSTAIAFPQPVIHIVHPLFPWVETRVRQVWLGITQ